MILCLFTSLIVASSAENHRIPAVTATNQIVRRVVKTRYVFGTVGVDELYDRSKPLDSCDGYRVVVDQRKRVVNQTNRFRSLSS